MRYDSLVEDVAEPQHVLALRQLNISSYDNLFALLRDESVEPSKRLLAFDILLEVNFAVDKRRAVWPLLSAIYSPAHTIRRAAFHALCILRNRQSVPRLIEMVLDTNQPLDNRVDAVYTLGCIGDKRALEVFRKVYLDLTSDLRMRSLAVEQTVNVRLSPDEEKEIMADYISLLADNTADVRFWAAYCLGSVFMDKSIALEALDRVVAFDHRVPTYWGWHVDREALLALEHAYYVPCKRPESDEYHCCNVFLISPAPEYETFQHQYRNWQEDWTYSTRPTPLITWRVDPAWFAENLTTHWPKVEINSRQPRPMAYLIDFEVIINGLPLSGALHRDGYALVLTGAEQAVAVFSAWYRGIVAGEQPLFLYLWADSGFELMSGIDTDGVNNILRKFWPYHQPD